MRLRVPRPPQGAAFLLAMGSLAGARESWPVWPETTFSSCPQVCCCKACSDPTHASFPYGILVGGGISTVSSGGPSTPKLVGDIGRCEIPTWARVAHTVTFSGSVPDTIWWTESTVFGDTVAHVAPTSCTCCRWSGVHQTCLHEDPPASRPTAFHVDPEHKSVQGTQRGGVHTGRPSNLLFDGGYELSANDIAELRNSTACGYADPAPTLRANVNTTNGLPTGQESSWLIDALPDPGCYRVCYYHAGLTTPTWYDMGTLDVLEAPAPPVGFTIPEDDVILEGLEVTLVFGNMSGYSIFDDVVELRVNSTQAANESCGQDNPKMRSDATSLSLRLTPEPGYEWCHPVVVAKVSQDRPRRHLDVHWNDCPAENRLPVPAVRWTISLPSAGRYVVCYKHHNVADAPLGAIAPSTWFALGDLVVPRILTVSDALLSLYTATRGDKWYHSQGWGTAASPCDWYGVLCAADGVTVETISLARNNLHGTLPSDFTDGNFSQVQVLNLEANYLWGTLPDSIGHWTALRSLDLGFNSIQGSIPLSLTKCPLRSLYLSDNILAGDLPYSLRSLVTLRSIYTEGARYLTPLEVPQPIKYIQQATVQPRCPTDDTFCPETGGTTAGVTQCGYDGITETSCVNVLGCCWNVYVGSGKPCFTKKRVTFDSHPQCTSVWCFPK
eukprot:TRINITY_DN35478_c0_g1_i1.p1 TRINITY_DN35478_c0_g1~~TRINITY_DN35478_c0_g1_i1.p1  ORF type:complete len:668 (+),score=117.31 TRINITY_DN35478_c0_g1_i1:57-2060(+)